MNSGDVKQVAVVPLTPSQRQRLESMTAVRALWGRGDYGNPAPLDLNVADVIRLTEYLVSGVKAPVAS